MRNEIIEIKDGLIELNLRVVHFIEDGKYIASIPSLNICASGSSSNEALANLNVSLDLFVEYVLEEDTLERVLEQNDWIKMEDLIYNKAYSYIGKAFKDKEVVVTSQGRQFAY